MHRLALIALALMTTFSAAQSSDPVAVSLAQKSIMALTGGESVNDAIINASIISINGSGSDTGTGTFRAKGANESRIDLSLTKTTVDEVRSVVNGSPAGSWSKNGNPGTTIAQHNARTDAAWFFPALSSLMQTSNPQFVFSYIGSESHDGILAQHIHSFQLDTTGGALSPLPRLSGVDFYLDPNTHLPLAVEFTLHSDVDIGVEIPVEIRFANYQKVNGIQVPFHFQRLLNGSLVLDVTVTSVALDTGLQDATFTLQ